MAFRALLWIVWLLALAGAARADGLAAMEAAPDLTVHYDLYTGGLRTIGIDAEAHLQGGHYAITADVRSLGLFDWMFRYHARHQVGGRLVPAGIRPELYTNTGKWFGSTRSVRLSYGETGPVEAVLDPSADEDSREPVPMRLWAGTVDPLSLVLAVNREAEVDNPCSLSVPVFDGRRRYNLRLEALGTDRLTRNEYSSFSGPALKCRVVWERVAGEPNNPHWQPRRPPLTTVWLARFGSHRLWLPVRLETESGIGQVIGHIAGVAALGDGALD